MPYTRAKVNSYFLETTLRVTSFFLHFFSHARRTRHEKPSKGWSDRTVRHDTTVGRRNSPQKPSCPSSHHAGLPVGTEHGGGRKSTARERDTDNDRRQQRRRSSSERGAWASCTHTQLPSICRGTPRASALPGAFVWWRTAGAGCPCRCCRRRLTAVRRRGLPVGACLGCRGVSGCTSQSRAAAVVVSQVRVMSPN